MRRFFVPFALLALVVLVSCEPTVGPAAGSDAAAPGDDLNDGSDVTDAPEPTLSSLDIELVSAVPADFGVEGVDYWIAKMRYGDNAGAPAAPTDGIYELELGRGHRYPADRATDGALWESGVAQAFSLVLDAAGIATLSLPDAPSGASVSFPVGSASGDVYLYVGVSEGLSVSMSGIVLDGRPATIDPVSFGYDGPDAPRFVRFRTADFDFSDGFELTGRVAFTWSESAARKLERPTIVLKVPY